MVYHITSGIVIGLLNSCTDGTPVPGQWYGVSSMCQFTLKIDASMGNIHSIAAMLFCPEP